MENKPYVGLLIGGVVVLLFVASLFFFLGSQNAPITGDVIDESEENLESDLPEFEQLSQMEEIKTEIDYQVMVMDELTDKPLEDAEIYVDGKLVGKTSSSGELIIKDLEVGSYSFQTNYKGVSKVLDKEATNLQSSVIIYIKAPRTITLELIDSETHKPIDDVEVSLETTTEKAYVSTRKTTDKGQTQIDNVFPGDYQLRINEFENARPATLITLGASDFITAEVNMPNPKFIGSISCVDDQWSGLSTYAICTVTLKNEDYGNLGMDSKDTTVALFVYSNENSGEFQIVESAILNFGSIPKGKEIPLETDKLETFSIWAEEEVVAVVYEGWKYTPEDDSQIGGIKIPQGIMSKFVTDTVKWCSENPGECGEAAVKVGKAVVGIIGMI